MHNSNSFRLTYYSFLNIIGFAICIAIASVLSWPIIAEITMVLSIYILFIIFGKYLFQSRLIQKDHDLGTLVRNIVFQLKHLGGDAEKG